MWLSDLPGLEPPAGRRGLERAGSVARWILGDADEILLASRSPRRHEMLARLGIPVRLVPVEIEERFRAGEGPEDGARRLAREKRDAALAAAACGPGGFVVAADTIVVLEGEIFGKPLDATDARRMLARLSGRSHRVVSGLAIAWRGRLDDEAAVTEVEFRSLAPVEIDDYVATGEPLDKAGAYGIQDGGALLVRAVRGDYSNVVGLPLATLLTLARRANVASPSPGARR